MLTHDSKGDCLQYHGQSKGNNIQCQKDQIPLYSYSPGLMEEAGGEGGGELLGDNLQRENSTKQVFRHP